ncbi:plasmid mobilization protein [Paraburkholderia aspalathi]|uniref:plasmid mobilization protein n=1 Tax=Paraburkholderia aspalathi TaxID=1324617 RepID=UPI001F3F5F4B|nr:hypothetical protein [Paraburkholderia aspalathi]
MRRTKSSDGVGLGKPIAFRLSDADRAVYLEKVKASGLSQSEFFRQAVLTNRTQIGVISRKPRFAGNLFDSCS